MGAVMRMLWIGVLVAALATRAVGQSPMELRQWGMDAIKTGETFRLPNSALYADEIKPGQPASGTPSFMWGCGVQLSALAAAAALDAKAWRAPLLRYAEALQVYRQHGNGVDGYDVLPGPKQLDRYYDDNAWIVLAMVEAYETTRDKRCLEWAETAMAFVLSGEDSQLGGGLYWHEQDRSGKHTCTNAPAICGCLRLYRLTRKPEYRAAAERLYAWVNSRLQDSDGLYFDNVRLDGKVEQTKWSYNSALMIRANCLFYQITREARYQKEAERIAAAAQARWVKSDTGAIADGAQFAHLFTESLLYLWEVDGDSRWLHVVRRALTFLHANVRDANGFYGNRWDTHPAEPLKTVKLLDHASAARAFLRATRSE